MGTFSVWRPHHFIGSLLAVDLNVCAIETDQRFFWCLPSIPLTNHLPIWADRSGLRLDVEVPLDGGAGGPWNTGQGSDSGLHDCHDSSWAVPAYNPPDSHVGDLWIWCFHLGRKIVGGFPLTVLSYTTSARALGLLWWCFSLYRWERLFKWSTPRGWWVMIHS